MIDIHCHILPNFDDGSRSMSMTLEMGRQAYENNVTKIVSTSHYSCTPEETGFAKKRDALIGQVRESFAKNSIGIELYPGAEVYLNDNIYYDFELEKLTINNTRYILCELNFFDLTLNKIMRYFDEIVSRKLVPILAHPERYEFFQQDYSLVNQLADMGTLFQVNMTSLAGIDSDESYRLASKMVESGMASFLATDAHSTGVRNMKILSYISKFPPVLDDENFYRLVERNPQKVLNGEPVRMRYNHIK
ncbi:MAG: hypothetical protein IJS17_05370 [Clostridia bacterium]|nr:hypothetical protein [Clostridia bacterium]